LIFHDHKTHAKKPTNFRNILEAQWRSTDRNLGPVSIQVPCVLGASYIVKKEWYEYCSWWELHRSWGTLEPLCSLSSWLLGGECRLHNGVETAHIFKSQGTHSTPQHHLLYNKMMMATVLFNEHDAQRLINFLGTNPQVLAAKQLFDDNKEAIMKKRKEYEKKIVLDIRDWVKRWNVDFRED